MRYPLTLGVSCGHPEVIRIEMICLSSMQISKNLPYLEQTLLAIYLSILVWGRIA